jgi:hypothetical protein
LSIARAADAVAVLHGQALGGEAGDDAAGDQLIVFANQNVHGNSTSKKASQTVED